MVRSPIITPSAIWAISSMVTKDHRFDLRFLRRFRADLSIRKSSSFFPPLIAATTNEVFRHGLPKSRLTDLDISAGPSFLSIRFHRLRRKRRAARGPLCFYERLPASHRV